MAEDRRQVGVKFRVGAFVLMALLVFLGIIYLLGARSRLFEPQYTIYAEFAQVGGLIEGATVRLAGVQIGRVTDVTLPGQPGGKVRVELRIGRQFADRIRRDSVARIDTQGLLGDKIVEITIGSPAEPPIPAGGVLVAREAVEFGQVVSESAQLVRTVAAMVGSLRTTVDAVNKSKIVEDFAAGAAATRRLADAVEKGSGWAHALVYGDPTALHRLDAVLAHAESMLANAQRADVFGQLANLSASLQTTAEQLGRSKALEDLGAAAASARRVAEQVERSRAIDDLGVAAASARRIGEQIEKGSGWAHTLIYEEPGALRRLDGILTSTQSILDRTERGEGAAGVLASPESTEAARRFVRALDRFGRAMEGAGTPDEQGLIQALLFDPKYKAAVDDLGVLMKNLRDVSDRLAGGRGTLGGWLKDEPGQAGLGQAAADLRVALANLRVITEKINSGEGTLGALIEDPTIYENLSAVLGGMQRSFLLRSLLRNLGKKGREAERQP
jgi:phospholipid/cholesterol/gamma-HCH transport system substrate-binding protein